jgi:putative PIN family toxin of toxin-antitoxin system
VSEPILDEIGAVLSRPEVLTKLHTSPIEARALFILLKRQALRVHPTMRIRRSRDPADDKFLECAVNGHADYLVSADADLLVLGQIEGIPILDVPAFWELLSRADRPR